MFEVICVSFAFVFGLAMRQIGLPPMVGFLAAGFAINALGPVLRLPEATGDILDYLSHLGVLLLLFAVGMKLRLRQIAQPQVLGGALLHFVVSIIVVTPGLVLFLGLDLRTAAMLAVMLAFSSTVFSAKVLEEKRDIGAFYGRTAIGILVLQDIIALVVLSIWGGQAPSVWALYVLALPLLRPLLFRILDLTGQDELLVLMGMLLALVIGGMGFEFVGLSSEIGALAMGLMLSTHKRAKELTDALWGLKEAFLVGFFLQIGMSGLPDPGDLVFAGVFIVLLPLKAVLFYLLLLLFRLRARSAFLAAVNLATYSELALILAADLVPDKLVAMALLVSLSFVAASPVNRMAQALSDRYESQLQRFQTTRYHRDELPTDLGNARILILGMGRTGSAAYQYLLPFEDQLVGIDSDIYKVEPHRQAGRNVLWADVEDAGFWRGVNIAGLDAAVLAMDGTEAKEAAAWALRSKGFAGPIISHVLHEQEVERLKAAGATHLYLTMNQAGMALADHTARALDLEVTPSELGRS
ncbi:cation:proton antiporter domain-containing protein [Paracoccus niistensis]|uniref:Cation:proton antiporter n=1 Tax=Paracoccus niistensis TaxID=632935 RepID=A0ABV6HZS3_9RHOB